MNLVDAKEVADQEMVQKYYEILVVEDDMYADEMWNQFWEQKTMKSNLLASIEKRNKYLKLADVTVAKHKADYKLLQDQKQREISDLNEKHGAECKEAKKIILGLAAHETALGNEVVALTKVQQMLRDELESKKSELEKLIRKSELAKSEHEALLSRRISDL